jgi:hypothetical protein
LIFYEYILSSSFILVKMISDRNINICLNNKEPNLGMLLNLFKTVTQSIECLYNSINKEILEELNNIHLLFTSHLLDLGLFTQLVSRFNEFYKMNEVVENDSLAMKKVICQVLGLNIKGVHGKGMKGKILKVDRNLLDKVVKLCCDCCLAKAVGK